MTYTDPTDGDDTAAIQSTPGIDAIDFSGLATNRSTLTADSAGVGPELVDAQRWSDRERGCN